MSEFLKPGDSVPITGIYKVVHSEEHVSAHYVTAISGDRFPACMACHGRVRFELALAAVQVGAHPQFYQ